jgi:hypothetical protein
VQLIYEKYFRHPHQNHTTNLHTRWHGNHQSAHPFGTSMNPTAILQWATDYLNSQDYKVVVETPWSQVIRFATSNGPVYLKQTPPALFLEPKIIQLLQGQFHANVPTVIASNDVLYGFLMKDAGITLRSYLKTNFQPELLLTAIDQHAQIQRSVERNLESFLALGVPDWRLEKLPQLYEQLMSQTEFLKAEGLTDKELQVLLDLTPHFTAQCAALSQYHISATLVQPDFNTNNTLFDPATQKLTFIDWGEIVISHPFFALHNYLLQAIKHHGVTASSPLYQQLQKACCEPWLEFAPENKLLEAFVLIQKLFPIYSALAYYRLMLAVDPQALKSFYGERLAGYFREYIASTHLI